MVVSNETLYGVAINGGIFGKGTVFAVKTDGTGFTNLHNFTGGSDGSNPYGGLTLSDGRLYGTTQSGGSSGTGVVFALNTDGSGFTTLYNFPSGSSQAGLALSGDTLYGTTFAGGDSGYGSAFSLKTNGTGFKTLHSFSGPSDGLSPNAGLIVFGNTLFGTATGGGTWGSGTVFALRTDGTSFTTLHNFTAIRTNSFGTYTNSDGAYPFGGVIMSGDALYGTTRDAGNSGGGTVFSISFQPELSILQSGAALILTWPSNFAGFDYTGYTLQSTTNLVSLIWITNLPAPVVVNGQYTVSNAISGTQQFFRLSQQ